MLLHIITENFMYYQSYKIFVYMDLVAIYFNLSQQ